VLLWRLLDLLPAFAETQGDPQLRRYLAVGDELQRYQFAAKLAQTFDRYLLFRPDLIIRWERGEEQHWQANLWRQLAAEVPVHWISLLQRMERKLADGGAAPSGWPRQVQLFGLQGLSPSYLNFLQGLSSTIDITLYQFSPSSGYWGDVLTPAAIARGSVSGASYAVHAESGNQLLAAWGATGRDRQELLQQVVADERDHYIEAEGPTLLAGLQRSILLLQELSEGVIAPTAAEDGSLQCHSCHSPLREIEVLHDQLLGLFNDDPGLTPAEVIVATPDPAAYWPLVEAVFGSAEGRCHVPFTLSGDGAPSAMTTLLSELIALAGSRYSVTAVMSLLDWPMVRKRFDIDAEELPLLHHWVVGAGIHWGIDPDHVKELAGSAVGGQNWREGLDRLLLGYAAEGASISPLGGLLPATGLAGIETDLLTRFIAFFEQLAALQRLAAQRHSAAGWGAEMTAALESLIAPDSSEVDDFARLLRGMTTVADNAALARFDGALGLAVWWTALQQQFGEGSGAGAGGGVRFVPLRSGEILPARVICLIGLNDGLFPRSETRLGFDLVAAEPRRGDRMRSADDRYLFLEALLCARERFYLSYGGQRPEDNQPCPPAIVVTELLDYLASQLQSETNADPLAELVTMHRLQPFSHHYFASDNRLFSYNSAYCPAPKESDQSSGKPTVEAVPPEQITRLELIAFLKQPARHLLRERQGINLEPRSLSLTETELLEPDGLANWLLAQQAVDWLQRTDINGAAAGLVATGALPDSAWGRLLAREVVEGVTPVAAALALAGYQHTPEPMAIDLANDGLRLSGTLPVWSGNRFIQYHTGKTDGGRALELWVNHLLLSLLCGADAVTTWVRKDGVLELPAVEEPERQLAALLRLYQRGAVEPIPLFPKTSHAFTDKWLAAEPSDLAAARKAAFGVWNGNQAVAGESENIYIRTLFAGYARPLDESFEALALEVFEPLLMHLMESGG